MKVITNQLDIITFQLIYAQNIINVSQFIILASRLQNYLWLSKNKTIRLHYKLLY